MRSRPPAAWQPFWLWSPGSREISAEEESGPAQSLGGAGNQNRQSREGAGADEIGCPSGNAP